MRQRGKRSAASFAVNPIPSGDGRIGTPSDLGPDEARLFRQVVSNSPPGHFALCDIPLLISFVHATLIERASVADPDRMQVWERAVRMQAALATKLRLTPQSRIDAVGAGRRVANMRPASAYDNLTETLAALEAQHDDH
jgi:hypothetical protein